MSLISPSRSAGRGIKCQIPGTNGGGEGKNRKKMDPISGDYHVLPLSNSLEISSTQSRHEGEYKCEAEGAGKRRTSHTGRVKIVQGEWNYRWKLKDTKKKSNFKSLMIVISSITSVIPSRFIFPNGFGHQRGNFWKLPLLRKGATRIRGWKSGVYRNLSKNRRKTI